MAILECDLYAGIWVLYVPAIRGAMLPADQPAFRDVFFLKQAAAFNFRINLSECFHFRATYAMANMA